MYKFEKLKVWQESLVLLQLIYKICEKLPTNEKGNLVDQIRRAATSISLNIAEGSGAENDKEFSRYLNMARKSLFETIATLKIIHFLYRINVDLAISKTEEVSKMLNGLKKYLISQDSRLKSQVSSLKLQR